MDQKSNQLFPALLISLLLLFGCADQNLQQANQLNQSVQPNTQPPTKIFVPPTRESAIPSDAIKVTPETDVNPPKSKSLEYSDPIPLPAQINTAGAEDSPFVTPDGSTLYLFFTPDVRIPVEKQILDNVTGIYVSRKNPTDGSWSNPERVLLTEPGKLAMDGCEFVRGNAMLFCSAREGYSGVNWFSAEFVNGKWQNWKLETFDPTYKVGELHISSDGNELYFHSDRPGGKGELDIWMSKRVNGVWQQPQNTELKTLNTERSDGWPFISEDGSELWISRDYGLWRSKKINGTWQTPELMFSPLAGEASLDREGNVYFVHHYFRNNTMIEADIYVAKRKTT